MRISLNEKIKLIQHGSKEYYETVALRYEILRKPHNLNFTEEQLAAEKNYFHLAYYLDEKLIACLVLVPGENGTIKMKQVAVANEMQGKGYGKKLVEAAEQFASVNKFHSIYCHARETAVAFYLKAGYIIEGDVFYEVTLPHYFMKKNLK